MCTGEEHSKERVAQSEGSVVLEEAAERGRWNYPDLFFSVTLLILFFSLRTVGSH